MSKDALVFGLMTEACFAKLSAFVLDAACLKAVVSKLLGYAVIAGAVFVKLPQILKLYAAKRTDSVAPSMYLFEIVGYMILVAYNRMHGYPFSTYGENIFLFVQNVILIMLIYKYNNQPQRTALAGCFYSALAAILLSGAVSKPAMNLLQTATIPIFAASRIPQIMSNYQAGSTGQLSLITSALNFVGNLARIFTTIQEVDDPMVLISVLMSTVLNGVILLQFGLYWSAPLAETAAGVAAPAPAAAAAAANAAHAQPDPAATPRETGDSAASDAAPAAAAAKPAKAAGAGAGVPKKKRIKAD